MNVLALVCGGLTLAAFGAHAVVGAREFRLFKPPMSGKPRTAWVQALAGWHWVSVSLLASGVLLVLAGATDVLGADEPLVLGQWLFCFAVAALAFLAR